MDVETKMDIIKSLPTEEILTEDELRKLLEANSKPKHYIGLEISGMPNIATILLNGKKINDFAKAGVETQVWLADWHTIANNKMGGDWEKVRKAAEFYKRLFNEVCPQTKVIIASDLYKNNNEYWKLVMQIARRTTIARATRTLIIQGRSERDTLHVSQYMYPMMQAADISALEADIAHAGMDQRRIHVLAKEVFKDLKMRNIVSLHHHLIPSLLEPPKTEMSAEKEEIVAAMKMSKSKPGSSIPILSTKADIESLLKGAWCPEGVAEKNPVIELCKYLIIPKEGSVKIERSSKYRGDVEYASHVDLETDYKNKKLHPADLKAGVSCAIDKMLEPINKKFGKEKITIERMFADN